MKNQKTCQMILVGHTWQKLVHSIDKEIFNKLIFLTEKEELLGSKKASETLEILIKEYQKRKVEVENKKLNFHIPTKPIAELTHLIYQEKLLGFNNIIINISGGLRYMDIWIYLAASITNTRIIHGDFIYEGNTEVGIHKNDELRTIYFNSLTPKQVEFLSLFFPKYQNAREFFTSDYKFDNNPLTRKIQSFGSIEEIRTTLNQMRNEDLTRGSINGYLIKLNRIGALDFIPESQNKKGISISFIGIAYFLREMYKQVIK